MSVYSSIIFTYFWVYPLSYIVRTKSYAMIVYKTQFHSEHPIKAASLFYCNYFLCISSHSEFWTTFCIITLLFFFYNSMWDVPPILIMEGLLPILLTPHLLSLVEKSTPLFMWIMVIISLFLFYCRSAIFF